MQKVSISTVRSSQPQHSEWIKIGENAAEEDHPRIWTDLLLSRQNLLGKSPYICQNQVLYVGGMFQSVGRRDVST